jgi:hypothetical protein
MTQSYYIFYIDGDIEDIFKIKTHPIKKGGVGELTQNINTLKTYFSHILFVV